MSGNIIAQALPILVTPILTRIYTPEDFGVLALFLAITSILGSIVNGRYELAIGLPKTDDDAINIAALATLIALAMTTITLGVIIIWGQVISTWIGNKNIYFWLYLTPISILLIGIFNVLNYLNNRTKNFKDIATSQVYKSVTLVVVQLVIGLGKAGVGGLIIGHISSQIASNGMLYKNVRKKYVLKNISLKKIKALGAKYKSFPIYSLWSGAFNQISHNISIFYIPMLFGMTTLGTYHLVSKVLGAPASLISSAIGQVFLQQATYEKNKFGNAKHAFNKTVKQLFIIGLPIFMAIFFTSEHIFAFAFGESWREAGIYAAALTPLFFTRFIVSTVSMMNVVFEKNHIGFYWQLALMLLTIATLAIAYYYGFSFLNYLYITSLILSIHYLLLLYIMSSYNKDSTEP